MVHEHFVHFPRRNFFPTTIDDLLEAARDEQVAIGIQIPLVPRPEPAMREGAPVGRWIVVVALDDGRATHDDLAGFTRWQQGARLVHNGHLWARCHPYRTGLPLTWRQRITGYLTEASVIP